MTAMRWAEGVLSLAIWALASVSAAAQTATAAKEDAAIFGIRQSVQYMSLSPSGQRIAYIAPHGPRGEALYVVDLSSKATPKQILVNSDKNTDLTSCDWATEQRLVCNAYIVSDEAGLLLGFTRVLAVAADGGDVDVLTQSQGYRALAAIQHGGSVIALDVEGKPDRILMSRQWVKEDANGTRLANDQQGLGVEEIDISTGRARTVERPNNGATRYIADESGKIRVMLRQPHDAHYNTGDKILSFYRAIGSDEWKPLSTSQAGLQDQQGFYPIAVDSARNVAYGFDKKGAFDALYAIKLDGSGQRELLLAREDVDIDGVIRIGRRNRVVGASYATERRETAYFDAELRELAASLAKALPGRPLISIVDASQDESKLLIVASSDNDPGMSYLYDKTKHELNELLPMRPALVGRTLATMKPVTYPAADGSRIPGYLTLPPGQIEAKGLPAIVMPHGGPGARDEWGFDWLSQFFAARGYAVLQPNFRGSAGYGSDWFGDNGFQAWRTAIGDVNDAGRWLVGQGVADPARLAIVGWSYGGYAALQSQVVEPSLYKAVVAVAPVTDLEKLRDEAKQYTSAGLVDAFIGQGDHVASGSPARHVTEFVAPVLLFHGTADQAVGVAQSRLMADRLRNGGKQVSYTEFGGLDHSLTDSAARSQMLAEIDVFLAAALKR